MNPKLKLTAYATLLILSAWFGWAFHSNYSAVTGSAPDSAANAPAATPLGGTNQPSPTNAPAAPDTNADATLETNVPAASDTNAPSPVPQAANAPAAARDESSRHGSMIADLASFVACMIGLGLLIAYDVTHYVGEQAVDFLFDDAGQGPRDPDYEQAEEEWANGKFLDAIQLMRGFLEKHPNQLHAALRIAEIYEKDLKNYLAAALEYEEILKHKLPPERWGWEAVHLCNLYFRLNQPDKAAALLRRVAEEYPRTKAAKKARAHLGIAEPEIEAPAEKTEAEPESSDENPVITMEEHPPELEPRPETPPSPPPPPPTEPPKSGLPPGFRTKK